MLLTFSVDMQFHTMEETKRTTCTRSDAHIRYVERPKESQNLNVYTLQMRGTPWWLHVDYLAVEFPVWKAKFDLLSLARGKGPWHRARGSAAGCGACLFRRRRGSGRRGRSSPT